MTVMIDLPAEVEARLAEQARAEGKPLQEYLLGVLTELATPKEVDIKAFLALPREEQDRLLATAVAEAEPLYAADLALPPHERELTAFTALDGETLYEYAAEETPGDESATW